MRLVRRILAILALLGTLVVLFRYRQNVENTIIETTFDAVAYAHAVEEEAASKLRQLPQVILPFKTETEKPLSTGAAASSDANADANQPGVSPIIAIQTGEDGEEVRDTGSFWKKWSQAIYDTRPVAPKITLSGRAPTQKPPKGDKTRQPYRDHVRNGLEDIESLRQSHQRFVEKLELELGHGQRNETQRQWKGLNIFRGRGIAMVGGGEYFGPAIISLHMLRRTGSSLPVEVFVPDHDEYEKEVCDDYLKKLDAKCVVLSDILEKSNIKMSQDDDADLKITHYQLKALAVLLSSFSEVLLLDSDSIPLFDPANYLFESEPYKSKGMIVWPDYWRATESPQYWTVAGRSSFPSELPPTASETGQLVVNKATHLAPLLLATYYNVFGPDYYYPLQSQGALGQGDKETFLAATAVLNSTFYRVRTPPGILGRHDGLTEKGTAMVQHLPSDDDHYYSSASSSPPSHNSIRPMFLHSNTPKMNAGHLVDENDLVGADGETRLRLLGPKETVVKLFGFDIEKSIWDLLVQTGCELQNVIEEWKDRVLMCVNLEEHYKAVFG